MSSRVPGKSWSWQTRYAPYLFLSPFVILFATFLLYPLVRSLVLSAYKVATPTASRFVGLDNYRFLFHDRAFFGAVANTIYYAVAFIGLWIPLSLGLALLLDNPRLKFRGLLRFAFFSSHLVGAAFVAVIFAALLTPRHGMINRAIGAVLPRVGTETQWLEKPALAMPAIVLASLWVSVGYGMVYFLAALQAVDPQLREAAAIDGAGRWARFRHVTLPGVAPVLKLLILVGLIGALQLFELPWVLFQQTTGPAGHGLTIVMYLYAMGLETGDVGYAAAVGWVLALLVLVISLIQWRSLNAERQP